MDSRIKEWIVRRKLKNDLVAERLGVSRETVSKWCNNKAVPSLKKAFELANLLNCKVDDLYYFETNELDP
ncbi:helix-turn-helix transcriptional regulator [Terribacillus sp. JSM ZJ617]|uniref:helix-turn-helix transcriptional regulator n=1 Tax=Terribacillus sp. JSM ZJ617 TaxID=3342119 RepID=UPI0035A8EF8E